MWKIMKYLLICISTVVILISIYTIFDNNRIKVVEQEILIDNLPKELEGYTILQISDLHEKEFGDKQNRLIDKINTTTYDAIVFTGDMLKSKDSTNYHHFYNVLEEIKNKETALFVPGNTDPNSYFLNNELAYTKTDFITGMEERGVKLLESIYTVQKGNSKIHFVEFELSILNQERYLDSIDRKEKTNKYTTFYHLNHQRQLINQISNINMKTDEDILIALNHYPVVDHRFNSIFKDSMYLVPDIDLILAGHYHGGQIRIPFLGAIFIPESWYHSRFFPPQDRVKGLWEYKGINQYVSTGLGSSDAIPFLKFRLFNTPEINLLTFRKSK